MKNLRNEIIEGTNEFFEEGKRKTKYLWNGAKKKTKSTVDSAKDFINSGKEKIVRKVGDVKFAVKT